MDIKKRFGIITVALALGGAAFAPAASAIGGHTTCTHDGNGGTNMYIKNEDGSVSSYNVNVGVSTLVQWDMCDRVSGGLIFDINVHEPDTSESMISMMRR